MSGPRFASITAVFLMTFCPVVVGGQDASDSPAGRDTQLVRVLLGRNDVVRRRTLAELRQNFGQRLAALDDLLFVLRTEADKIGRGSLLRPSTVELIYLIGTIDRPEAESALIELLDDENGDVAMLSADALGRNKFYGAIPALERQVEREEYRSRYAFRFNLVRALAQMEHPDAIETLSEMKVGLDGQLDYEIEKLLSEVTLEHFRGDEQRFDAWQKRPESGSIFRAVKFSSDSYNRIKFDREHRYYGIDIVAKRLLFVLDNSGSMKKYAGGATRLGKAKRELIQAIEGLPSDAEFSIVFFATNVHHWRENLVQATDENKRYATLFVERLGYGKSTNTYGALREAFDFDDDLEAVFLLTDGRPTTGAIVPPSRISQDILHRNRFRHLNINTIGISVAGATEAFLKTLAEESAGEFRAAD